MSGQRINDRSSWMGKGSQYPLPLGGGKMKSVGSAEGAGDLSKYEDTNETIVSQQKMNVSKAKGHAAKPGYRN